jgi:ParB-like chromosome segregation protein Spo0J
MQIILKKIKDLLPYVNNARTHDDYQIDQIAASIKEFGFTNPILIDANNGIIAGHGRLLAAKKLKILEVPTIELSNLTDVQKRAYIIADNKLALNAGWDEELLKIEFDELLAEGFDLDLTGFSINEISNLNCNAIDITEVNEFNEKFNISIICDDLIELAEMQRILEISGKKITAKKIIKTLL